MKIGVIVGRFQVAELTEGHKKLIDYSNLRNDVTFILVGCKEKDITDEKNPLPFEVRKNMLLSYSKSSYIYPFVDRDFFAAWVSDLDEKIYFLSRVFFCNGTDFDEPEIILYGGRDSFLEGYDKNGGIFVTEYLDFGINSVSGSEQRKQIKNMDYNEAFKNTNFVQGINYAKGDEIIDSADFRRGIIFLRLNINKNK